MPHTTKRTILAILSVLFSCQYAQAAADVSHGETLYQGCQDCHSLDTNDVGPKRTLLRYVNKAH